MIKLRWFQPEEFDNFDAMDERFLHRLDEFRSLCGFPLVVNSDYRHPSHPLEITKDTPGVHSHGIAVDLQLWGGHQRRIAVDCALEMNFGGIGIGDTFIHVDDREGHPILWTYD